MRGRGWKLLAAAALSVAVTGGVGVLPARADGPPLAGAVHHVSDLDWASMENGWGPVERDMSNGSTAGGDDDPSRSPLMIGATRYAKGLGAHAPSSVVYNLGGQCRQLLSDVGIDASQGGKGRVDFRVLVDGVERFAAARRGTDPAATINLDLAGADRVELRVDAGPEGNGNDHADWANARFNCTDAYIADPLRVSAAPGTDLAALVPGTPAAVIVEGLSPLSPVALNLGEVEVARGTANEAGVATITFVVPANTPPGPVELRVGGTAPFGVPATGTHPAVVIAISTTRYHVDCSATAPGDGSQSAPYNSIPALLAHGPFQPGESILFRAGVECVGALTPAGTGLPGHPITISSYGGSQRPTINGDGALAAVRITNASHWTVSGLHVRNPAPNQTRRVGILFENNGPTQHAGVVITDNHVEDVAGWRNKASNGAAFAQSAGIMVRTEGRGAFDGITITDNRVNDAAGGGLKLSAPDVTERYNTSVRLLRNDLIKVGGDAIVVHNSDGPLIEHNRGIDLGAGAHPYEGGNFAGMWPFNSRNPLFQFNVVGNSSTSAYDSTAWDCDMRVVGTCTFQYNYSWGNAGGFYLNCISNCGGGGTAATVVLRHNIAQDDCRLAGSSAGPGKHLIYNNTFYCPSRIFLDDMSGPREMRNNIIVAPGGTLKTNQAVYATNAYHGGIRPPAGESDPVLGDPGLIAAGSGMQTRDVPGYRLAAGSPLIGRGTPIADGGTRDFFGNRVLAKPSIGADQGSGVARTALPFERLVNQTSVTGAGNPRNGAITADRRTIPEQGLADAGLRTGDTVTAFGAALRWHPTPIGTPDTLKSAGQELAVDRRGSVLLIAGFATGVGDASGNATVHYADGTSQQVTITLPHWRSGSPGVDTALLARSAYHLRHTQPYIGGPATVQRIDEAASVFATRVPIDPTRRVESVTLPAGSPYVDEGLNILGVGVGGSMRR